ncbi:MAG: hypothetical protein ACTHJK_03715 [Sphingomicrobium sp.]
MTSATGVGVIAVALLALGMLGLGLRTWIASYVDRTVGAKFDKELEAVRSDLRVKENKITALQSNVLSGRAERRTLLSKRRIEAIEHLWSEVLKLDAFTWPATVTGILKMDAVGDRTKNDPNIRRFLETISGGDLLDKLKEMRPEAARPFVPVQVWNLFAAYRGLLIYCFMRLKILSFGMGDEKLFKDEEVIREIKEVMPHFSDYLDKWGVTGAVQLMRPLRELIFEAVRTALTNDDEDLENVVASGRVMSLINELDETLSHHSPPAKAHMG